MDISNIILIQISACLAETLTFPIESIKVRMQVEQKYTNIYTFIKNIYKQPNTKIYSGLQASLMRQCVYASLRLSIYDNLRNKNISNNIIQNNGIKGFWKGCIPSLTRSVLHNMGSLPSYDISKSIYKKNLNMNESTTLHVMSSLTAGFSSALLSTPADVVKSRLMRHNSPYNSIRDCIYKSIKNDGIMSLYRGFFPIWMRLAPWQLTFWITYEQLRYYSNKDYF